jgi:HSP20 family protein
MDELQPWEEFPGTFPISRFSGWGFWQPSVDLAERAGEFIVRANLPGMRREDIQLTVDENSLTLQGEVQEEKTAENERFYRRERRRGSFIRPPLQTPVRTEAVTATFNNGVLEVHLPKMEPAIPRGRRVEIQ